MLGTQRPATAPATAAPPPPAAARRRLLAPILAVVALGAVAAGLGLRGGGDPAPAQPAPAFSLPDVRGGARPVALAQRAGRPVVLNFFASWCVPCRDELPVLERASRREGGRVAFIGVAVADKASEATGLLDEAGVTYPAGADPGKAVAGSYRLRGMPTTVFIGSDGRIRGRAEGPLTAARLDGWLGRLRGSG